MSIQETMTQYFSAEKAESALFMIIGLGAVVSSFFFWKTKTYRGIVFPLCGVALIQLVVGGTVFFRTDSQVTELQTRFVENPAAFQKSELERMQKVAEWFKVYKAIEILLLAIGVGFIFWRRSDVIYSAGLGLIVQSAIMLVLDLFAERRADVYIDALRSLMQA